MAVQEQNYTRKPVGEGLAPPETKGQILFGTEATPLFYSVYPL